MVVAVVADEEELVAGDARKELLECRALQRPVDDDGDGEALRSVLERLHGVAQILVSGTEP